MSPELHNWQHLGEGGRRCCPQDGGETVVPSERPPPTPSPCSAVLSSRCSTLEKIDCLFLPDCSRVTGCKDRGGGG